MQALETLLKRFAERTNARWWIGQRPNCPEIQMVRAIATHVGYPTARIDPFATGGMIRLDWKQAAHVLAVAGTMSLPYSDHIPTDGHLKETMAGLKSLNGNAMFFGNGFWGLEEPNHFISLTSATFDCGVVGYDNEHGFIFWVEEED